MDTVFADLLDYYSNLTSYLDIDNVINLTMVSTRFHFACLNNLKNNMFIPAPNESKCNLLDYMKETITYERNWRNPTIKQVKDILKAIKSSSDVNVSHMGRISSDHFTGPPGEEAS